MLIGLDVPAADPLGQVSAELIAGERSRRTHDETLAPLPVAGCRPQSHEPFRAGKIAPVQLRHADQPEPVGPFPGSVPIQADVFPPDVENQEIRG